MGTENAHEVLSSTVEQSQVDDIFGDVKSSGQEGSTANVSSGISILLDKNISSMTRLPILEVILDGFNRIFSNSLRSFLSYTADVEIEGVKSIRFGEYIDSLPVPTMIAPFKALEWDNYGLMVLDGLFIYSIIDILFGGRKITPSLKVDGRPFTSIERGIVQVISEMFLTDLSNAFEAITVVNFQVDRLESNPKFASISRPEDIVVCARLNVRMEARQGRIDLVLPYATIEPIKKILVKSFIGEKGARDPVWIRHMEDEIVNCPVEIEAIMNGITITMNSVNELVVGNTIILEREPEDDVCLSINDTKITTGKLGKVGDNVAIMLSEHINIEKYND